MRTDEILFLLARLAMVGLCGHAALAALRRLADPPAAHMPAEGRQALLGGLAALLGVGIALALHDSWENLVRHAAEPITLNSWLWLSFDLGVPLLTLRILRTMAERDAALARLAAVAVTDPLTGLANRRGFALRAEAAVEAARRGAQPCAVLAFDLDRFKAINDGHGHAAGDAVLRDAAAALAAAVRAGDVIGRLGGEEFAALLPAAEPRAAAALAERLREAVRAAVRHPAGGAARVTVSIGVAPVARAGSAAAALEAALNAADAALYAAKRNGRDRVEMAGSPDATPGALRGAAADAPGGAAADAASGAAADAASGAAE